MPRAYLELSEATDALAARSRKARWGNEHVRPIQPVIRCDDLLNLAAEQSPRLEQMLAEVLDLPFIRDEVAPEVLAHYFQVRVKSEHKTRAKLTRKMDAGEYNGFGDILDPLGGRIGFASLADLHLGLRRMKDLAAAGHIEIVGFHNRLLKRSPDKPYPAVFYRGLFPNEDRPLIFEVQFTLSELIAVKEVDQLLYDHRVEHRTNGTAQTASAAHDAMAHDLLAAPGSIHSVLAFDYPLIRSCKDDSDLRATYRNHHQTTQKVLNIASRKPIRPGAFADTLAVIRPELKQDRPGVFARARGSPTAPHRMRP